MANKDGGQHELRSANIFLAKYPEKFCISNEKYNIKKGAAYVK